MNNLYAIKDGKPLRCGYTTGSCAAGAAKAAAIMLRTGRIPEFIEIDTPAAVRLTLKVEHAVLDQNYASCGIVKDAGDDPDVTNGITIYAEVRPRNDGNIFIDGGEGIGRITREGFWGKVGQAAINPVPRQMIRDAVSSVADHGWDVLISAPQGADIAKKTFNAQLGIEEGISIIGTTGIVQPMSDDAIKKTIYLEIDQIAEQSTEAILLCLGNYGERMAAEMRRHPPTVKISNFIGDALSYCYHKGFEQVTLLGHIGKLSKVSIGAFNTHNRVCDVRIEAFIYYLALAGAPTSLLQRVSQCKISEEVLQLILDEGYEQIIYDMREGCLQRIRRYVKDEHFNINILFYSMKYGVWDVKS